MFSINILTIDLVFFSAISNQIDSLQFKEVLHFKEIFQRLEKHFVKKKTTQWHDENAYTS